MNTLITATSTNSSISPLALIPHLESFEEDAIDNEIASLPVSLILEWIKTLFINAPVVGDCLRHIVIDVTPMMAKLFMRVNSSNRNIKSTDVHKLSVKMSTGVYTFKTGEAIKFKTTGHLKDGQHRCKAVIKSGTTQKMLFCYGITDEAATRMDDGRKRTLGDRYCMKIKKQGREYEYQAAILRYIYFFDKNGSSFIIDAGRKQDPDPADLEIIANNDKSLIKESTDYCMELMKKKNFDSWTTPTLIGAIYYLLVRRYGQLARVFLDQTRTQFNITGSKDPAKVLNDRLKLIKQDGGLSNYMRQDHSVKAILLRFNDYISKKTIKRYIWNLESIELVDVLTPILP